MNPTTVNETVFVLIVMAAMLVAACVGGAIMIWREAQRQVREERKRARRIGVCTQCTRGPLQLNRAGWCFECFSGFSGAV